MIRTYRSLRHLIFRVSDGGCIVIGLALAHQFGQRLYPEQMLAACASTAICFLLVSSMTANYRSWRGTSFYGELVCVWTTWTIALASIVMIGAITQYGSGLTRWTFGLWTILTAILLGLCRAAIRMVQAMLRKRGIATRGFAIVGVTDLGIKLAQNIEDSPHLGLAMRGFYDDRPEARTTTLSRDVGNRMGRIDDLVERCRKGDVGVVYITFPMRAEDRIRDVISRLADSTASVYIVPNFFVFELLHSRWTDIQGIPAVSVFENPFFGVDGVVKRIFDLVVGSIALLLCALPMLFIAMLVRATSAGPILFRQRRYGLDGQVINVLKFRSMHVMEDGEHVRQATRDDSRVTKVGRFIRRTSLDELPQLLNVLSGEMSLVGPRPHASAHNEQYRSQIHGYMLRHKVKPGITGLAQVNGWRGETDELYKMEKRVEFDHRYIREWSIWLDLSILCRTPFVAFSDQNAY
jgi:putative colanic acid biosynthesis UDP-glucose lipid carrier transferase